MAETHHVSVTVPVRRFRVLRPSQQLVRDHREENAEQHVNGVPAPIAWVLPLGLCILNMTSPCVYFASDARKNCLV